MSAVRFLPDPARPALHGLSGPRAALSLRLVWLLALLIVVQSLLVQAHGIAHLPPPVLPDDAAVSTQAPSTQAPSAQESHDNRPRATALLSHHRQTDDDPAQCPLCREEALSGHYLAAEPFEFAPHQPDHFAPEPVLRPVGTPHIVSTRLRIRGPPASLPA